MYFKKKKQKLLYITRFIMHQNSPKDLDPYARLVMFPYQVMYLFFGIAVLHASVVCCRMLYFCPQTWVILYSMEVQMHEIIMTCLSSGHNTHTRSCFYHICFIITSSSCSNLTQLYALYLSLPVTQTIIVVRHYPVIFIVFRRVSLHISAFESISGYGCRVFGVSQLDLHQINKFR